MLPVEEETARGQQEEDASTATMVSGCRMVRLTVLSFKVYEPLLVVGLDKFAGLDIRVRVSGGGHTSQI